MPAERQQFGPHLGEPGADQPEREAVPAYGVAQVGTRGHDHLVPSGPGRADQRNHRQEMAHQRVGGEQELHGRSLSEG